MLARLARHKQLVLTDWDERVVEVFAVLLESLSAQTSVACARSWRGPTNAFDWPTTFRDLWHDVVSFTRLGVSTEIGRAHV